MICSKRQLLGISALLMVLPIGAACNPNTAEAPPEPTPEVSETPTTDPDATTTDPTVEPSVGSETIAEVAATDPSLSTFNTAIESAGLVGVLNGSGPYTVFAPSDSAFEALPQETLQQLMNPENQDQLAALLAYHVVPEELSANQIESGQIDTLAGVPLAVEVDPSVQEVFVSSARVTQPDLQASNGIIHVVDQVILPPNASR